MINLFRLVNYLPPRPPPPSSSSFMTPTGLEKVEQRLKVWLHMVARLVFLTLNLKWQWNWHFFVLLWKCLQQLLAYAALGDVTQIRLILVLFCGFQGSKTTPVWLRLNFAQRFHSENSEIYSVWNKVHDKLLLTLSPPIFLSVSLQAFMRNIFT